MITDITLGQYFPGTSPIHRLDPRVKIILTILYITVIFLAKNVWSFAFLLAVTAVMILISRIPLRLILKGLKPLIFIIAFTAVVNIFWTTGEKPLVSWWIIQIYPEGLMFGALMIVRVVAMLAGTSVLLTYTTSPIALTDGLERLLYPLSFLHVPVHEFSMMMTLALRFVPTLVEETDKIMKAQMARGVDFKRGSLVNRVKALIPIMIPLFVSAFRRAGELAVAMECRCYRGGEGRTRMTQHKITAADIAALLLLVLVGAATVLINRFAPGFTI